jgi:hypothetical protein
MARTVFSLSTRQNAKGEAKGDKVHDEADAQHCDQTMGEIG